MFCVIPFLLLVSNALALLTAEKPHYNLAEADSHFADFIRKYEKQYETAEEYNARFEIFKEHLVNINRLNKIHETVYAVNKFSDISYEEFKINHFCLVPSNTTNDRKLVKVLKQWIKNAPDSLDYRDQNLVTPAKDQKACGSCYAFAGVGSIEGQHAKKHKELISLSEQQALDCDTVDGHCNGSNALVDVMNEIAKQGGIEREEDYPYEAKDDTCRTDKSKIAVKVTGGIEIDTSTDDKLKGALVQYGPLSVAMNGWGLPQDYRGGVLSPKRCNPTVISHAVLLVGYGKEEKEGGKDYWIVKNSWGASWGMQGFFYLEKGYCGLGTFRTACATVE
ncbi:hypothetical protein MSG28_002022 [Choristoneura fumiferana]|uniref:Uncharacterized protein n=1 Tax=Choristoneura fumiferana TaxID=7141 RepID=A0ACC0JTI1_CHOFU|nr:hypothetical protein MSG28_002022 [Choristoneura fumiferana]